MEPGSSDCQLSPDEPWEEPSGDASPLPKRELLSSMLLPPPELPEWPLPDDCDDDDPLCCAFIPSPLAEDA